MTEARWRLPLFLGVFLMMSLWQWLYFKKANTKNGKISKFDDRQRSVSNWGLALLGAGAMRLASPLSAVAAAQFSQQAHWGLLGLVNAPDWLDFALVWLVLDVAIYWQHRIMHLVPALWRLHRVHHSDTSLTVSTALRFHPLELLLSTVFKFSVVLLLGAPVLGVVLFEASLSAAALFGHGRVRLGETWELGLSKLLITPSLHQVHHSVVSSEMNCNFGTLLSCWDRMFRSFCQLPETQLVALKMGVLQFRDKECQGLLALLLQPLVAEAEALSSNSSAEKLKS